LIADKAAADKAAADKAAADKAAADIAAADKAAADKAAADKAAADAKLASEAEAAVITAAIEKKAASNTVRIINSSKTSTKLNLNLADKYFGETIYVEVRTKTKTGFKTRILKKFEVATDDGTVSITTKKLLKGQTLIVRVGSKVLLRKAL
jgi:hypothetical protein